MLEDVSKNAPIVQPNGRSGMLLQRLQFFKFVLVIFGLEYTFEKSAYCKAIDEFDSCLLIDFHHGILIPLGLLDEAKALQPFEGFT